MHWNFIITLRSHRNFLPQHFAIQFLYLRHIKKSSLCIVCDILQSIQNISENFNSLLKGTYKYMKIYQWESQYKL